MHGCIPKLSFLEKLWLTYRDARPVTPAWFSSPVEASADWPFVAMHTEKCGLGT